eukprot:gene2468-2962_t
MRRNEAKLVDSARQADQQLRRDLRSLDPDSTGYLSKDLLKVALGPKYLALNVTEEEIDALISELGESVGEQVRISYYDLSKFLGTVNVDPNAIPFFDAKAGLVTSMKKRVDVLEKSATDPSRLGRIAELRETLKPFLPNTEMDKESLGTPARDKLKTGEDAMSRSLTQEEYGMYESLRRNASAALSASSLWKTESGANVSAGARRRQAANVSTLPSRNTNTLPAITMDSAENAVSDFVPSLTPAAKTRLRDPSLVLAEQPRTAPLVGIPLGKRREPMERTDWSRVGVGGDFSQTGSSLSGMEISPEDRYKTTSGSYFSPLLYSNSSPQPERDVVGDADRCTQERKERLQRRQRRTEANLEMTRAKAELDELLQQNRADRRVQTLAKSRLRYE